MRHAEQVRLIHRIHGLIHRDERDEADRGGATPVATYLDPDRLGAERGALFDALPAVVGHASQVTEPGAWFTTRADRLPLLVSRDAEGELHALVNVCRHRGMQVASGAGCRRRHVCPYHAWTYDTDGALLKMTDADGFVEVDRATRGLVPVPVAVEHGLVVVRPRAGWWGGIGEDLDALGLADHVIHEPRTLRRALNWKLVFDVFAEAYHLRYAHKRSIYPMFFDNLGVFDRFRPHMRNLFPKRTIQALVGTETSSWSLREHSNLLYVLFPNTLLLVQPDHCSLLRVYPEGPAASRLETCTLLREAPTTDRERAYWQKNHAILYGAIEEDFAMGEAIQAGLSSGANTELLFGRFEQALAWFHSDVEAFCQSRSTLAGSNPLEGE